MAISPITKKAFLDGDGTGYLYNLIKARYDAKLDEIIARDASVVVADNNKIGVLISSEADNVLQLKTTGNRGLYVPAPATADTYTVSRAEISGDYSAVYRLMRSAGGTGEPTQVGVDINIPKDMVVQSGTVETKSQAGAWGPAGTYIHLVLANADNSDLYINVSNLIEYVTSGSQAGDMVMINIDPTTHEVTASVTDDSITAAKLAPSVRSQISRAASAVQSVVEGTTNGTVNVDGIDVAVHGLNSAAYTSASSYDPVGSALAVLGTSTDTAADNTVYGAKQLASDAYTAIQALTNAEIDAAIASATV